MSFDDRQVENSLKTLIDTIRNSEVYCNYRAAHQKVAEQPELLEQINNFRRKNFIMQQTLAGDELLERSDDLAREYAGFRENPLVDQYLSAELSFCRMKQGMDDLLLKELEFC
jgi:cell fate (sporulation/competence/biofilm development) regulator YlbF (YheA/YmcA/DUF963 family)